MAAKTKKISVFVLTMMNVALVMSLRGLPLMAKEGLPMLFFLLFSAIIFLIPTSLIAAELATGWPGGGGVYRWVKEAFGPKWGFAAIWLQWVQNVSWYPTSLSFVAGCLSYCFCDPSLANNRFFNICVILGVFWSNADQLPRNCSFGKTHNSRRYYRDYFSRHIDYCAGLCLVLFREPPIFFAKS